MPLEHANYDQTVVGWPVYAPDGDHIGDVKEIRGHYFKVDVPMRPDYWLRDDCIMTASGGQVLLNVPKDELDRYHVDAPETDALADAGPVFGSTGEDAAARGDGLPPDYRPSGVAPVRVDGHTGTEAGEYREPPTGTPAEATPGVRIEPMPPQGHPAADTTAVAGSRGERYGRAMAADPRYAGRSWEEVEPDLHAGYSAWAMHEDEPAAEMDWAACRDGVRRVWDSNQNG